MANHLLLAIILIVLAGCTGKRSDEEIRKEVTETIKSMKGYQGVQANVRNRIVILTGQCKGEGCAGKLETAIKKIDGVEAVETDITEGSGPGGTTYHRTQQH